ncbi:hypothetical protein E1140_04225 [Fulvivirga lutimaris]|nr:hypothetical protein [Fulvivirga lutimaris]
MREFPKEVEKYKLEIPENVDRSRIGPKNDSYIYHDLEFSLSRDEIVKLLLTNNLYKSPSILVRELLQNSLDAIRLRKASYSIENLAWGKGKVSFRHYIDDNDEEILECHDNGCGMDETIITQFLGKVGRSYYRSPEFERKRAELKAKGADFEPCSQFGIGFMSCFMFGDRIEIYTRKDYGHGKEKGKPLFVEINGINGLIVIKEGNIEQEFGTTIKIHKRQKSLYFDPFSDNLKLVIRLKGVALATEFPIQAKCEIEGIQEEVEIPAIIDKKRTFLEKAEIKEITTFEIDLSKVDSNLKGYLRQSFLIDSNGIPTIENEKAKWELIDTKNWKDKPNFENVLHIKESNKNMQYNYYSRDDNSICLDGILVCGAPGRVEYATEVKMFLGEITATATSEHPFTLDVRGKIKPELSPSREPLKNNSMFDTPFGWRHMQHLLSIGSSLVWEKILDYSSKGMSIDTFWKLLMIYDGRLINIKSKQLLKHLQLPYNNGEKWIKLSEINNYELTDGKILIKNMNEVITVDFPESIKDLSKAHPNSTDFDWWIAQLLVSISEIDFIDGKNGLKLNQVFNEEERPSDNVYSKPMRTSIKYLDYNGISTDYITSVQFSNTVNRKNPIINEGFKSRNLKHRSEIEEFSLSLASVITNLIDDFKKEQKPLSLEVKWRPLKYLSSLYTNIKWSKYGNEFKPPYKVYNDNGETVEITDEILKKWGS